MSAADGGSDFTEEHVKIMLNRSPWNSKLHSWVQCGSGKIASVRMNWVTFVFAVIILFGFSIVAMVDPGAGGYFGSGKAWVAQNFTWLYILTQDVWCAFLIYLCFSRFGSIKLGRDDEKPKYNDFSWFCMLFTCGVAVGLYVFGVSEPLYFYRQPSVWHSWAYDYAITKAGVENDAQRAQQAVFMAIYHWGIHGWVPYILLALLAATTSFRWNMPMTIRSCFYPLIGDHALGLAGDIIDSFSIATTTFGVCTSLALGVSQLVEGLEFVKNIGCDIKANCATLGGTWDLNTYGANSCVGAPAAMSSCDASWLASADSKLSAQIIVILVITSLATLSVLSGLDRGIKFLSKLAFTLGMIVCLTLLYADNTWYMLSVMVQTLGYYLQYVIQVGFDCEAFQQLAFEFNPGDANKFWGSAGTESVINKLSAHGIDIVRSSADCGDQINPCKMGMISASMAAALTSTYAPLAASAVAQLKAIKMSPNSINNAKSIAADLTAAYGGSRAVPCGSGWNTTNFDGTTGNGIAGDGTLTTPFCSGLTGAPLTACTSAWASTFPRCPETVFSSTGSWGTCESYLMSCPTTASYFDDTNPMFMDWWTIFYWAWWITWAPFVGFFVALVSRGRTVRELIIGGFICPTLFAVFWFGCFGGLAIKMERTAELALQVKPDIAHAAVTCSEHYSGDSPITPEAKALKDAGYYLLSCIGKDRQIYRIMEPYKNLTGCLHFFLWIGLVIYFLTSSDSGSMTDDIISASGLSAKYVPAWQKVWWCWTEAIVAIALISAGSGGAKAVQALSIIIGLPYTLLLCLMVPSCMRVLKKSAGDEDIQNSKRFNTQLLDVLVLFKPNQPSPCTPGVHMTSLLTAIVCPFLHIKAAFAAVYPDNNISGLMYGIIAQVLYIGWIIFHIIEETGPGAKGLHTVAWLLFTFFLAICIFARIEMRRKYNVWGSVFDDVFTGLFAWPLLLSQLKMAADTNNEGAPGYWDSADEMIAELAAVSGGSTSKADKKVELSEA